MKKTLAILAIVALLATVATAIDYHHFHLVHRFRMNAWKQRVDAQLAATQVSENRIAQDEESLRLQHNIVMTTRDLAQTKHENHEDVSQTVAGQQDAVTEEKRRRQVVIDDYTDQIAVTQELERINSSEPTLTWY